MENVIALGILKALFYICVAQVVIGGTIYLLASWMQRITNPYWYETSKPFDKWSRSQVERSQRRSREEAKRRLERELARQEQRRLAWIEAGRPIRQADLEILRRARRAATGS